MLAEAPAATARRGRRWCSTEEGRFLSHVTIGGIPRSERSLTYHGREATMSTAGVGACRCHPERVRVGDTIHARGHRNALMSAPHVRLRVSVGVSP